MTGFMFFDDIQNMPNNNGLANLINPLNIIKMPFIPNSYSLVVSFGFVNVDTSIPHRLTFQLKSPNGDVIVNAENLQIEADSISEKGTRLPLEAQGYQFNLNMRNVKFMVEGEYKATIQFDDKIIAEYPLYVYLSPEKG